MNLKLIDLAERRATLIAKAAAQREEISRLLTSWSRPLAVADRGWEMIRRFAGHPAFLAWAAALLLGVGPRRTLKWLRQGLWVLRLARVGLVAKKSLFGR
jgi:hypothetical protein